MDGIKRTVANLASRFLGVNLVGDPKFDLVWDLAMRYAMQNPRVSALFQYMSQSPENAQQVCSFAKEELTQHVDSWGEFFKNADKKG
jgi:hypothetical protein